MRVAILDDYQQVALASADWSAVRERAEIHVFTSHIARTEALVNALEPFDVIVAMRERTPFDAERLSQLPRLRLLVTTGMSNASIDLAAARAQGITVCGTGGSSTPAAGLTWGLILALARHIPAEDQRLKMAGRAGGAALRDSWQRTVGTGLAGKRLGLVGLGHQGRAVAQIGRAFGMKLAAWSQNLDAGAAAEAQVESLSGSLRAVERDAMRGTEQHNALDATSRNREPRVGVGGDRSGIDVAGMRGDQRLR